MTKKLFDIAADLHLAPRAWLRHPGLEGDSYYGLKQIVNHVIAENVPLILAGDIFDKTRPDPVTVNIMRKQLKRIFNVGQAVYYIQGQHEYDKVTPWLTAIDDRCVPVNKSTVKFGKINVYGLDWHPATMVKEALATIPDTTDILISHQVWRDLMGRIGESECSFNEVSHVKMVITGDFHKHLSLKINNKQGREIDVLSPGSTCMQSINEEPDKSFFIVNDDFSFKSCKIKSRKVFRARINNKEELDKFLQNRTNTINTPQRSVPDYIAKNIVNVVYNDSVHEIYERLTAAFLGKAHAFLSPIACTRDSQSVEKELRRRVLDKGLEYYLSLILPQDSQEYADGIALLGSQNPRYLIDLLHENYLKNKLKQ